VQKKEQTYNFDQKNKIKKEVPVGNLSKLTLDGPSLRTISMSQLVIRAAASSSLRRTAKADTIIPVGCGRAAESDTVVAASTYLVDGSRNRWFKNIHSGLSSFLFKLE